MSTLEFVSTSAGGIAESDAPLVTAPALLGALGTHPAVIVPLVGGRAPDTALIWRRLADTARFFGTGIPSVTALRDTLHMFLDEAARRHGHVTLAARVMVVEIERQPRFVVSASVIEPVRSEPVVLAVTPQRGAGPTPHWRRMAARTSSRAEAERTERDLRARGYADEVVTDGAVVHSPRLGALVVDGVGVGAEILELLRAAGLSPAASHSDGPVAISGATHAWWVSPRFETHPIGAIGAHRFEVAPV